MPLQLTKRFRGNNVRTNYASLESYVLFSRQACDTLRDHDCLWSRIAIGDQVQFQRADAVGTADETSGPVGLATTSRRRDCGQPAIGFLFFERRAFELKSLGTETPYGI